MIDGQLIIDAELFNPKVNNKDLLTGSRINPEIGLASQDLAEGDNITIEKTADGRLRISASVPDAGVSYTIFSETQKEEFLKNLPSRYFCYLSTLFSGIDINLEKINLYYVDKSQDVIKSPPEGFSYDINGDVSFTPPDTSLGEVNATMELKDNSYENGQGGLFTINTDIDRVYYTLQISKSEEFSDLLLEKNGVQKEFFVSFGDFETGDYFWRLKIIDISNLHASLWTSGNFSFTWEEPPYADVACPSGLTSSTSDPAWVFNVAGWNRNVSEAWNLFSSSGFPQYSYNSYFQNGENYYISWTRSDGKKLLAKSGCSFMFEPSGPGAPRNFWIEGSNDGNIWETIFSQEITNQYQSNPYTYSFSNDIPYTYLRVRFDNSYSGPYSYVNKIEVY